ncbi:transposase [Micromonospora sp. NPDC047187]|uniref:transposase n=1 Tax=Micromonospora sp. NPDC047187 TaxID=3155262 RepID=UPI003411E640
MTDRILTELREQIRVAHGREPKPTAGIIDSQSVKGADTVSRESRGYDAGKKINGRKRFIVTDTLGLLVTVWVLAASWHDQDGAKGALLATYAATPIRLPQHVRGDDPMGRPRRHGPPSHPRRTRHPPTTPYLQHTRLTAM